MLRASQDSQGLHTSTTHKKSSRSLNWAADKIFQRTGIGQKKTFVQHKYIIAMTLDMNY
jgi:hypothetical protein